MIVRCGKAHVSLCISARAGYRANVAHQGRPSLFPSAFPGAHVSALRFYGLMHVLIIGVTCAVELAQVVILYRSCGSNTPCHRKRKLLRHTCLFS